MILTSILTISLFIFWILGLWCFPPNFDARSYTHEIFYITGAIAWLWMTICLVIAARPSWIEKVFRSPLDRLYVFHKWLGFAAVAMAFVHYFVKDIFGPILRLIWTLTKPPKKEMIADPAFWDLVWSMSRTVAKESSVWLTWIALILVLLCLTKKIPYKRWLKIHSVFAWVFIFLSLHSLRLMKVSDFYMPFGLSIVAITVVGLWASINLLRKGPGWQKKMKAHVTSISEVGSDCIRLEMKTPLGKEVLPGQFLFVHLPGDEGHPFSIAEFSDDEVILWIKKSGDFTNFLLERLHTGDIFEVEGPWGEFIPIFSKEPQSWCAAGIGIAPFNAWLKAAAKNKHGSITLFWTVKDQRTAPFVEAVRKEAEEADVPLMLIDKSQARLTVKQIMQGKPEFVAFCGLALLQKQLRNENYSKNLIIKHEVFNWRDI